MLKHFIKKNVALLFRPIPITHQEAMAQKNELNMTQIEILYKIDGITFRTNE